MRANLPGHIRPKADTFFLDYGHPYRTFWMMNATPTLLYRQPEKVFSAADRGIPVRIRRKGKVYSLTLQRPRRSTGAAKHMSTGKAVSAEPVPKEEWQGNI